MTDEQYTERYVRDKLIYAYADNDIAFNLVGVGPYGHEMDFIKISDRGYVEEYEIKISKADILAESKKGRKYDNLLHGCRSLYCSGTKHPFQIGAPYREQSRWMSWHTYIRIKVPIKKLWIAVPTQELAEYAVEHTEPWVGVVLVTGRYSVKEIRKAKQLQHCRPLTDFERCHILRRVAIRYWRAYRGVNMPSGRGGKMVVCSDDDKV